MARSWVKALRDDEKTAIADRCDVFIRDELKPRFLPQIRPTQFNYPVDIFGKWRGSKYRFDVMWHRHTGQWFRVYQSQTLDEALESIRNNGLLHPL